MAKNFCEERLFHLSKQLTQSFEAFPHLKVDRRRNAHVKAGDKLIGHYIQLHTARQLRQVDCRHLAHGQIVIAPALFLRVAIRQERVYHAALQIVLR